MARKLAGRYSSANESLEDLVQVASVGLLGAIDRFDPHRETRFAAFAIPTILGELKRHFRDTGWSVRVPRSTQEMALRVDGAARRLAEQSGRAPRVDTLARDMDISVEEVLVGLQAATAHFSRSLDAPVPGSEAEDAPTRGESLGSADDRFALIETKLSLAAAIPRLPYAERQALRLRIYADMKQSEIAVHLGCSQMQVSRLLHRAAIGLRRLTDPDLSSASSAT